MDPNEPVHLSRASVDLIGREIKNFRGRGRGEQPVPQRRRGSGGGGSSSSATIQAPLYVVTTEITAATGDTDEITPGEGEAIQYEFDSVTGVATPIDMEPVTIYNYDPGQTYAENVGIYVATVPDTELLFVLSAHCTAYDVPA